MQLQDRIQFKNTITERMLPKGRASVLLCLVLSFFLVGLYAFNPSRSSANKVPDLNLEKIETNKNFTIAKPTKLIIPSIGVDAKVEHVGFTKRYTMASPSNYTNVGWYRYGTSPGQKGSAVIAGHLDNGFGFDAVFANLKDLKKGDVIYVQNEMGNELTFIVEGSEAYDYTDAPLELIFNENDKEYLKLITCKGSWVNEDKTYNNRLVVTAVLKK